MSSILEALKKLEEEKATRLSGAENIAGKVVRSGRRPRQRPGWWLPAGMACAALIAAAATYVFTGGFFTAERHMAPAAPAPSSPAQTVAIPPAAPPQAAQTVAPPTVTSAQPAQSVAEPPVRRAPPPELSAVPVRRRVPAPSPTAPIVRPRPVLNAVPRQQTAEPNLAERTAPPPQIALPSPSASSPSRPKLTVSGIGWQKDNADRLAIVNGKAVSEGTIIEGARVEEIFPDRVKFSMGEQTFDISLGKGGETP